MFERLTIENVEYCLGLIPTHPSVRSVFTPAYKVLKDIPQNLWVPRTSLHFIKGILNQGRQGACVGFSTDQAAMIARRRQGLEHKDLSAGAIYGSINGGYDGGASIGDALQHMLKVGTCLASTIGNSEWQKARRDDSWKEEAKDYRFDEAYPCSSVEEFLIGLQQGFDGVWGVAANGSFKPDARGFMNGTRGGVNHAVVGSGMKQHPDTGDWYVEMPNSWDATWGINGVGWYPVSSIQNSELWIVRNTIIA